ncbi:MAG: hypothetical protein ABSB79_12860 [Syntrophales bacterium]|jgi:hypothetical protein
MIIDIHTHLGDILNKDGGRLIDMKGVKKRKVFDPISSAEIMLHRGASVNKIFYILFNQLVVIAERA